MDDPRNPGSQASDPPERSEADSAGTPTVCNTGNGSDEGIPQTVATLLGQKIGNYTIKSIIGSGGMGTVYEAMQEQPRRRVAIKVMRRGITSRSALRRFEFEAQTLGRLRHPGIAQVYEAGTHGDGEESVPYFVMEYIPNARSITEYAQEKQLGTRQRLALFSKVCDAVQHGHLKGIVHRDLKPGNILVDSSGQPRVIDFGVARSTDSDMAFTTLQTDIGQLIGTIQYMSPEQCEADPSDIDIRSDVYALGMILYELLTGKLPYDVTSAAIHEAVRMVREEEPTKPSTFNHHLRGDVETITLKALEKDRKRRYQSATALEQDIGRYLSGDPIAARPPGAIDYLYRFARKHTAAAAAITVVFVILVGAVIAISIFAYETTQQRRDADAQRVRAEMQEASATAVKNFTMTMLASVNPDVSGIERKQQMQQVLVQAADSLHEQFRDQPLVEAEIRAAIGTTYQGMGLYDASETNLADSLEIYQDVLGRQHPDTLTALHKLGGTLIRQSKYEKAERCLQEALNGRRQVLGDDDPATLGSIDVMGSLLYSLGRFAEAKEHYQQAIDGRVRVLGEDHENTLDSIGNMGNLLLRQDKLDEAERYLHQALEGRRRTLGHQHPRTLWSLTSMSMVCRKQGRYNEAETHALEALEGHRRVLGDEHPSTLAAISSMGNLLYMQKKYDEAGRYYGEALAIKRRTLGEDHPQTLGDLGHMGNLFHAQGDFEQAEHYYRQVFQAQRRLVGDEHLATLRQARNLATALFNLGKYKEAERFDLMAFEGYRKVLGDHAPETLGQVNWLIALYDAWHKDEPDAGHDTTAAEYRALLDAVKAGTAPPAEPPRP